MRDGTLAVWADDMTLWQDAVRKNPTAPRPRASPWATSPDNSYYGDPRYVAKEQHGLEDIERDKVEEEGVEQVVILGYN